MEDEGNKVYHSTCIFGLARSVYCAFVMLSPTWGRIVKRVPRERHGQGTNIDCTSFIFAKENELDLNQPIKIEIGLSFRKSNMHAVGFWSVG